MVGKVLVEVVELLCFHVFMGVPSAGVEFVTYKRNHAKSTAQSLHVDNILESSLQLAFHQLRMCFVKT